MAVGRPTKALNVTPEEKEKLRMRARRPKSGQALAMRARIVLGCEEGGLFEEGKRWLEQTRTRGQHSSAWIVAGADADRFGAHAFLSRAAA